MRRRKRSGLPRERTAAPEVRVMNAGQLSKTTPAAAAPRSAKGPSGRMSPSSLMAAQSQHPPLLMNMKYRGASVRLCSARAARVAARRSRAYALRPAERARTPNAQA